MAYPASLDTFSNKVDGVDYPQASDINPLNEAIEALEAKVGVDSSVIPTSLDFKLKDTNSGHDHNGSNSKKVIATNLDPTGLTVSQLLRINSAGTAFESSGKTVPTGDLVGLSDTQILTNKRLNSPKINEDVVLTASSTELNKLAGVPAGLTSTEIGYLDGVTSNIQTQLNALASLGTILSTVYPIGSLYFNYSNGTNPGTLFGFGTWVAAGVGRTIIGIDATQTEFDIAGETGGEKIHLLTGAESGQQAMTLSHIAHSHVQKSLTSGSGSGNWLMNDSTATGSEDSQSTGTATVTAHTIAAANAISSHNNLQPYEVYYMWRRTA